MPDGVHSHRRSLRPDPGAPYSVEARRGHDPSPAEQEIRRVVRLTPTAIARWWATSLSTGYVDDAVATYAADAAVQLDDKAIIGHHALGVALDELDVCHCGRHPDRMVLEGDDIEMEWWPQEGQGGLGVRMVVEGGEIVSQKLTTHPVVLAPPVEEQLRVDVVRHGRVPPGSLERAVAKVRTVAGLAGVPVKSARVKLQQLRDPAATRPALVDVSLDLDGEIVRAHWSDEVMADAIDRVGHRLEDRLRHRRERMSWERPTNVEPEPGEWRHGNMPTTRPPWVDRPTEEREVVRHKTWDGDAETVDEAAFDLEMLDHDFHLFTELRTGADSLLLAEANGYELAQLGGATPQAVDGAAVTVRLDEVPPPTLTIREAVDRLDLLDARLVFFEDRSTRRGALLYRRRDGNYGLVTPAV